MVKTLITGAGLVGCHVAQKLVEMGQRPILFDVAPQVNYIASVVPLDKVTIVIGDITDISDLVRAIQSEKIEQVVHTAFMLTSPATERPLAGVRVNIGGTSNVLEAARLMGVRRVVFTSSMAIYCRTSINETKGPYTEDMAFKSTSERLTSIYAVTKLTCEHLGLAYYDLYSLDFIALRVAGIFGPYKTKGIGGFNTVLIRDIVDAALSGKALTLERPPGWPIPREFVYVKDVAGAIVKACSGGYLESRVYNIGSAKFYDFPEVVEIARRVFPGAAIKAKEGEWTHPMSVGSGWHYDLPQPIDITLAQRELGYVPEYDMEKAITDFGNWVMKYDQPQ
jgi:nucleoside-diphosphate-sugar epimerase